MSVPTRQSGSRTAGGLATLGAFVMWGVLPVFWKALAYVPSTELLAHRIVFTVITAAILVGATHRWGEIRDVLRSKRSVLVFAVTATALGVNWFTFIHAVNSGQVVECSLGYFINPLVSVFLGFLFLEERFRPWQIVAIVSALVGVLYLTLHHGRVPWIALTLAGSFGLYGLLRKTARYEALPGLLLETSVLLLPTLVYLAGLWPQGWTVLTQPRASSLVLLPATGIITAAPLVAFAFGARRIRLATVGFLQYLTPTGMFLLGIFAYREPFTRTHLVTFAWIWAGLALYTLDLVRSTRARRASSPVDC